MKKIVTFSGIFTAVILLIAFGSTPNGDITDSKSAVKNTQQGLLVDKVVKAGGGAIETTGKLAVESACKNGSSQGCSIAISSFNIVGILFAVLIIGIIIAGVIGAIKFGIKLIETI